MKKGYWIVQSDITNTDAFMAYVKANVEAMQTHGAKYLVRAGQVTTAEGSARARNTIVEFPSYQAALDCWNSPGYQAARALREGACEIDLLILEGLDG
jgi:uncharacterized protein (DUF1330 family)